MDSKIINGGAWHVNCKCPQHHHHLNLAVTTVVVIMSLAKICQQSKNFGISGDIVFWVTNQQQHKYIELLLKIYWIQMLPIHEMLFIYNLLSKNIVQMIFLSIISLFFTDISVFIIYLIRLIVFCNVNVEHVSLLLLVFFVFPKYHQWRVQIFQGINTL